MNLSYFADGSYAFGINGRDLTPKTIVEPVKTVTPAPAVENPFTPEATLKICYQNEPKPQPVAKPKVITKYAIIDHVGQLTTRENKEVYKKVSLQAKADGLPAHTLKKVCLADSPYAREVTSKMKYRARYLKNPQKVYLICDTLDSNAESVQQIWESRGIPVEIFEVNGFMETHQLDIDGKASINRRLAEIWAPAFGYSFSAPITRIQRELNSENFVKRPDHDALVASGETHFTKPYTSAEMYLEMTKCIAPDAEIKEFRQYLNAYLSLVDGHIETRVGAHLGTFVGNASALQEFLNPDYIICPDCGRPLKIHSGDCECPHCQTRFTDDVVFTPYFEDSSDIDE